eukprot:7372446-Alexandrium_andersonii.AAC.1
MGRGLARPRRDARGTARSRREDHGRAAGRGSEPTAGGVATTLPHPPGPSGPGRAAAAAGQGLLIG